MKKTNPAFTIVELIVTIVIIAILMTLVTVSYNKIASSAKDASLTSGLSNASKALETYKQGNSSAENYPVSLSAISNNLNLDNSINWKYYTYSSSVESLNISYCLQGTLNGTTKSISSIDNKTTDVACIERNLIAWWSLNGNANDSSGNNNNGALAGNPLLTSGQNNSTSSAYSFNGTESQNILASDNLIQTNMSISLWVKLDAPLTTYSALVGNGLGGDRIGIYTDSSLYNLYVRLNGVNNQITGTYSTLYQKWANIVATYDGKSLSLYINGSNNNSIALSTAIQPRGNGFGIGMVPDRANYYTKGSIDDVRIYNRALLPYEVMALYDEGAK